MDTTTERPGIRGLTILMHFGYGTVQMRTHREMHRPTWIKNIGWTVVRIGLRIMTGKTEWEFKKV